MKEGCSGHGHVVRREEPCKLRKEGDGSTREEELFKA